MSTGARSSHEPAGALAPDGPERERELSPEHVPLKKTLTKTAAWLLWRFVQQWRAMARRRHGWVQWQRKIALPTHPNFPHAGARWAPRPLDVGDLPGGIDREEFRRAPRSQSCERC